nr:translation initiation factor 1 [Gentiana triflora]QZJ46300.1 translation initiation factor 1 [Gentiana scabra]QZJ46385.1 translation initiation factor 1 [Gentiana triflora]
MIQPEGV